MLLTVLDITAPVFLLGAVGVLWAWAGVAYDFTFVSRLVLNISLPCLVFSTLATTRLSPEAMAEMAGASALAFLLAGGAMWALLRALGLPIRTWWTASVFGNTGNFGLPLCLFAFGEEGLALAMVLFAIGVVFQFTLGLGVIAGKGQAGALLRQPMVYAAAAGVVVAALDWPLPEVALRSMALAGQIAIPLMLITLGVSIAQLETSATGRAGLVTGLRTVTLAASGVAAGWALGLGPVAFGVLVLQFLTPAAVTVYMMSARYGTEPGAVAGLVLISTLLAVALVPAVLPFLL
ncbi:MAG: AEC family transporter [Pseudomonadota bacterium]